MSKQRKGSLIVISGPSGAGKSTVISEVMRQRGNIYFSVSYTTRAPREGEQDGINYHYIDNAVFEQMIAEDAFLEYAGYVDHYYGTARKQIEESLAAGVDVILDIEVQGAAIIQQKCPEAVLVFLTPSSYDELERRLTGRQSESDEVIRGRLARAREEYRCIPKYDYLVLNDVVDDAVHEVCAIMDAATYRVGDRLELVKEELLL